MTDSKSKAWYVARRGVLLAETFLQELKPILLLKEESALGLFDFIAIFQGEDLGLRLIAVEVKAIEEAVTGQFQFSIRKTVIESLQRANFPVLVLIANVKDNQVYFGWARDARFSKSLRSGTRSVECRLPLQHADGKNDLLKQICGDVGDGEL